MRERIEHILKGLKAGAYERDEAIALSLLSALAGESIFMLGLPGVGKSLIARRLKLAFSGAKVFEYLMSRFSTPDEIFGPVSISKLKNEDCYERVTAGYLPEAEVLFLDEIWKAGPAIQNSLLTVLNEKIYLNGNRELHLPVKAIIAASNELPAEGEGLEALWDRFLIRYIVEPIKQKANFFKLIGGNDKPVFKTPFEPLSSSEYAQIIQDCAHVELPDNIKEFLYDLRKHVNNLPRNVGNEDVEEEEKDKYYTSDRRWKKIVGILRTSAYLNGRRQVDMSDALLLEHMLWENDVALPHLRKLIAERIVSTIFAGILKEYKNATSQQGLPRTGGSELYSADRVYYQILCDDFILKLRIEDYDRMKLTPSSYYFASETQDSCLVLLETGQYSIRVTKPGYVCINSYNYPLITTDGSYLTNPSYRMACITLEESITHFRQSLKSNLFTSESKLRNGIFHYISEYRKRFNIKEE